MTGGAATSPAVGHLVEGSRQKAHIQNVETAYEYKMLILDIISLHIIISIIIILCAAQSFQFIYQNQAHIYDKSGCFCDILVQLIVNVFD